MALQILLPKGEDIARIRSELALIVGFIIIGFPGRDVKVGILGQDDLQMVCLILGRDVLLIAGINGISIFCKGSGKFVD